MLRLKAVRKTVVLSLKYCNFFNLTATANAMNEPSVSRLGFFMPIDSVDYLITENDIFKAAML